MKHPFAQKRIGEILLEKKWLQAAQLEEGLRMAEGLIGEWLVERRYITEEQLAQALALQFHLPYVDLKGHTVPPELFESFPASEAYRLNAIPYGRKNGTLQIALSNPLESHQLSDQLEDRKSVV